MQLMLFMQFTHALVVDLLLSVMPASAGRILAA